MKKLIISAFAIVAACAVNAAAINWDNGNGDLYESSGSGDVASGYLAYFFDNAVVSAATFADAYAADSASTLALGYASSVGLSDGGWLEDADVGNFTPGTTVTGYLVVFDAATPDSAAHMFVSGTEDIAMPGSGMGANVSFDLSGSVSASNWQATAAPEPTSGLLLLLGVAGLALKRKRA